MTTTMNEVTEAIGPTIEEIIASLVEPIEGARSLPVELTKDERRALGDELARKEGEKSVVEAKKSAENKRLGQEIKELKTEIAEISALMNRGTEQRDVRIVEGFDRVTGEKVVVRLDTNVVWSRKPGPQSGDVEEGEDEDQPSLFGGRRPAPPVPALRFNGINADGEIFVLTAEQADVADREIREQGHAMMLIEERTQRIEKVVRGRACDTCSIVNGHRPECAGMKADADAEEPTTTPGIFGLDAEGQRYPLHQDDKEIFEATGKMRVSPPGDEDRLIDIVSLVDERADDGGDSEDDENDTAAIAARIDEVPGPNDAPLVPPGDDAKPILKPVKPKRTAKKKPEAGAEAE